MSIESISPGCGLLVDDLHLELTIQESWNILRRERHSMHYIICSEINDECDLDGVIILIDKNTSPNPYSIVDSLCDYLFVAYDTSEISDAEQSRDFRSEAIALVFSSLDRNKDAAILARLSYELENLSWLFPRDRRLIVSKTASDISVAFDDSNEGNSNTQPNDAAIIRDKYWQDDHLQFARLLAELKAAGLHPDTLTALKASMDLETEDICEIMDRAEEAFEFYKMSDLTP